MSQAVQAHLIHDYGSATFWAYHVVIGMRCRFWPERGEVLCGVKIVHFQADKYNAKHETAGFVLL